MAWMLYWGDGRGGRGRCLHPLSSLRWRAGRAPWAGGSTAPARCRSDRILSLAEEEEEEAAEQQEEPNSSALYDSSCAATTPSKLGGDEDGLYLRCNDLYWFPKTTVVAVTTLCQPSILITSPTWCDWCHPRRGSVCNDALRSLFITQIFSINRTLIWKSK